MAVLLLAVGLFTKVPSREISLYSFMDDGYKEYVGGDAYNIQIEASIRGGEIARRQSGEGHILLGSRRGAGVLRVADGRGREKTAGAGRSRHPGRNPSGKRVCRGQRRNVSQLRMGQSKRFRILP